MSQNCTKCVQNLQYKSLKKSLQSYICKHFTELYLFFKITSTFLSNEEVDVAVREWLRMQGPDF
jgi:hypothetical protein